MKQGSGKHVSAGGKTEPRAHAISIDKVSNIGVKIVRTHPQSKELSTGRGFEAPKPKSETCHKAGSQGRR